MRDMLVAAGIDEDDIRSEEFADYPEFPFPRGDVIVTMRRSVQVGTPFAYLRLRPRPSRPRPARRGLRTGRALFDRFILFVVSFSRDLVGRTLLEMMKHECDA